LTFEFFFIKISLDIFESFLKKFALVLKIAMLF